MNIDSVNAFRQATLGVLESYGFADTKVHSVLVADNVYTRCGAVVVEIALSGDLTGMLVFAFPRRDLPSVASQVVRAVVAPDQIQDQQDIASELANIVAGRAMGQLYGQGFGVDISPPSLHPGPEVSLELPDGADSVVIPVTTAQGSLEVVVSLQRT